MDEKSPISGHTFRDINWNTEQYIGLYIRVVRGNILIRFLTLVKFTAVLRIHLFLMGMRIRRSAYFCGSGSRKPKSCGSNGPGSES